MGIRIFRIHVGISAQILNEESSHLAGKLLSLPRH